MAVLDCQVSFVVEANRRQNDNASGRRIRALLDAVLRRQPRAHLLRLRDRTRPDVVDQRDHGTGPQRRQPAAVYDLQSSGCTHVLLAGMHVAVCCICMLDFVSACNVMCIRQ